MRTQFEVKHSIVTQPFPRCDSFFDREKSARVAVVRQADNDTSDEEVAEEEGDEVEDEEILSDLPDDQEVRCLTSFPLPAFPAYMPSSKLIVCSFPASPSLFLVVFVCVGDQPHPLKAEVCQQAWSATIHAVEETVFAAEPYRELGSGSISTAEGTGGSGFL